jgi:hypothetical protein
MHTLQKQAKNVGKNRSVVITAVIRNHYESRILYGSYEAGWVVQLHENQRAGDVNFLRVYFSVRLTELAQHNFMEVEKRIYSYIIYEK